jgi:hypothetical protein
MSAAVKKRLRIIILFSLLIASIAFFFTKLQPGKYKTYSKIFPLSINKSSTGVMESIKAQFGISDNSDYDKIYNVKELVNSKTISMRVVRSASSNKKYKDIAHWLIDDYNNHLPILKKKYTKDPKDTNAFYYRAAALYKERTSIVSDKTDFTKIETYSYAKELCKEINETILKQLSDFYIQMSTAKAQTDLVKIKIIKDSLKEELDAVERAIAGFQDSNQFSERFSTKLPQAKLTRLRSEIEQLYATSSTAYQNARFKLLSESPIFQVLDSPGEPYIFEKPSSVKSGVLAFVVTFIVGIFIAVRKIIGKMIIEEFSN